MKRFAGAILMAFLAVSPGGTAYSENIPGDTASDCLANAITVCSVMAPRGDMATEVRAARRAAGVVTRSTGTVGRYAGRVLSGFFAVNVPVSIYTPQGDLVARGKIHNVFDDEVYFDVGSGSATPVAVGFAILMNYPDDEAARYLASARDALNRATLDAKTEAKQIEREIASDARRDAAHRQAWQEDMEKLKYQLGFYDYPYYYYYSPRYY